MKCTKTMTERLLALTLSVATAFSAVPTQALAEVADSLESTPVEAAAEVDETTEDEQLLATGEGEKASEAGTPAETTEGGSAAEAEGETEGETASDEAASEAAEAEEEVESEAIAVAAASVEPVAEDGGSTTVSLSSNAKVYIQASKDYASCYSTKSGALKIGDKLYANMFDGSYSYSLSSVSNPGTWTYTWYAGTVAKSSTISDYTEIVGTEQELTVTADMAGKYLICKVTADGVDYYGPATSNDSGINANYIPGPVLAEGQASLNSVKLSNTSPSVGDTLTATAYTDYSTAAGDNVNVTYTWSYADSKNGTYAVIEGETGNALTLTDTYANKFIQVTASAGVNEVTANTSDAVLAAGAVKLAGVELNASSTEVGATLTAKAYTGSSYSPTYVDNSKVTYTWKKYKGSSAPSSSTTWEIVKGQTGATLTVTDDLEGYYVSVSANAGANDATYGSYSAGYGVGPFRLAGSVDIYSAVLAPEGSTSGTYTYTVDDTVQALAKEKGASEYIDSEKLAYQWQVSDTKGGDYADIEGATSSTLDLANYQGKFVRCVVSSKIGSSTYTTRSTTAIAAAGSVNVTKVALDASSKAEAGKTITATATASGTDVTSSEKLTWSWYWGEASGSCTNKIDGATTNTFTPDAATYAGKYVQARVDGGFGEEKSNAVAVVEAGSVELYGVTVSGAQTSGAAQVGAALTAKATKGNSYTYVSSTDTVHYQWQYSETNSTSDANFKNIPDAADSATYVVDESMLGCYIRVIASSENSVKSTQAKTYYGSTTSVDPVGPVVLAGQYKLASVAPAEATTATLTVGTTLTPSVKIPGSSSYSTSDLPSDAKLTTTWYVSEDGTSWEKLTGGVDAATGALTLGESLVGKKLKLEASALDNTVSWTSASSVTAEGTYELLRVTVSPQMGADTTYLVAGDTVAASAQAKRVDGSATTGIDVTSKVTFAWYAVDGDGSETKLEGLGGPSIQVPDAAAGKTLKVVATSGDSNAELSSANTVIAAGSLEAAVQKLNDAGTRLSVDYSADGANVNDILKEQLKKLGFDDIDVKVKADSVSFNATDSAATVGISSAADDTNGDVTFFYIDPNDYTGYYLNGLRTATLTFELSKGDKTVEYTPKRNTQIAWDEAGLQQLLEDTAKSLTITYATDDTAESVTGNVTLPYRAGSANKFAVEWTSSDTAAISVSGSGWSDYAGKVTRSSTDSAVTLTATVKLVSGDPELSATAEYPVTVKSDPEKVAAAKAELEKKVETAFTYGAINYFGTKNVADKDGLTADLQMLRPSGIGVDGSEYKVTYSADTSDVVFNGYKGIVYQPKAGEDASTVKLTCTVTSKENAEITASKTLEYKIAPQDADDLAAELKLMEAAEAGYAAAILDGQDATAVTGNLHAFQKAYLDADGNLAWAYNTTDASAAGSGIVLAELDGASETAGYRVFKSSDTSIITHENLLVTQPDYSTEVTISSRLVSEKYARYAELYPDDETYAKLAGTDVSATVKVKGTAGDVNPIVTVNFELVGVDANGSNEIWSNASQQLSNGSTAADLIETVLDSMGLEHTSTDPATAGYYYLSDITSADGRVLGWDETTGKYWQLFVNGEASMLSADGVKLATGDSIVLWYSAYGDDISDIDKATVKVSMSFIGPDANGNNSVWAQATDTKVTSGTTAAELSVQLLKEAGLTYEAFGEGASFYLSTVTGRDGKTYGWDQETGKYWQLFVNGEVSNVGAGSVTLQPGDNIQWVYSAYGEDPLDGVIYNPDAQRSGETADWSGFINGGSSTLVNVPTPTDSASILWKVNLATDGEWVSLGDPIIVGGNIFVTTNSQIVKLDSKGNVVARVSKGGTTSYFSRPVYADGLLISANDDGSIYAFSTETLECVWSTPALEVSASGRYQANNTMTVANGCVYVEFVAGAGYSGAASAGAMVCVDLATGKVNWTKITTKSGDSTGEGYYWAGACASGTDLVIGDESGYVKLIDGTTGDTKSSVKLDNENAQVVRTTIVSAGTENGKQVYLAVGRCPATLYKIARDGDTLSVVGSCKFGYESTSTPAVANGKVYIGGNDSSYVGQFYVIDLESMKVEESYETGKYAPVQSSPLVSVQGDDTCVYFTCNKTPGVLLRYSKKDAKVVEIYTPTGSEANYCTASVIADASGNLYYTNDSGTIFALKAAAGYTVTFDSQGGSAVPSACPAQNKPMVAPSDPVRACYTFLGWYTDAAGTTAWDFSNPVTSDMTLYAKWQSNTPASDEDGQDDNNGSDSGQNNNGGSGSQISINGNAKASSFTTIALTSTVAVAQEETDEASAESLLSGFSSGKATGTTKTTTTSGTASEGARQSSGEATASTGMPIWPFIGLGIGAAALIIVLVAKHNKEDEE